MSNPPSPGAAREARAILTFLYLGYLLSFADRVIFGMVLKPIKATLGFSDSQLGLLAGLAFALSYAVFSPLAGWFVDRRPRKQMMAIAVAFWSLMTLATGFAGSFLTMGLARLGVGAGEAFLHPLSVSLVSDTVEPRRRARAFAVYLSAGALGSAIALLFGGLLIRRLLKLGHISLPVLGAVQPWQALFVAAAVPGFLLALAILAAMREPPRLGATHVAGGENGSAVGFLKANPRLCWAIFGGISFLQMAAYTMTTWKIVFFERVHGWSAAEAGVWLGAAGGGASLVGCLAGGRLIGWLRRRGYADAPLRLCVASGVCYAVFSVLGLLAPTPHLAIGLFVGSLFWSYVPSVAGFTAMGEILPVDVRARLAGLHTFANGLISNSLGPFLVGLFSDRLFPQATGIRYAMVATVVIAAVLGLASVISGLAPYRRRFATAAPEALLSPANETAVVAA
jgi:MFS family permease